MFPQPQQSSGRIARNDRIGRQPVAHQQQFRFLKLTAFDQQVGQSEPCASRLRPIVTEPHELPQRADVRRGLQPIALFSQHGSHGLRFVGRRFDARLDLPQIAARPSVERHDMLTVLVQFQFMVQ